MRPEVPRANARSIRHGFVPADWQPVTPRRPAQGTAKRCCHHECARARIGRPQARQDPTLEPPWRPRVRIRRQRVRQDPIWRLRDRQNLTLKDSDLPGWQRRDASAALQAASSARAHAQLPMSRTQHARSVPRSCRRCPAQRQRGARLACNAPSVIIIIMTVALTVRGLVADSTQRSCRRSGPTAEFPKCV